MKSFLFLLSSSLIWLCICSCKKNVSNPSNDRAPIQTEHGIPAGISTGKVIGTEGGILTTPDGKLRLKVPKNALDEPVNFTVQPVSRTLESATGTVYRLMPADIVFDKELELTIQYSDEDLLGTDARFLYLVYQDEEGYWHRMPATKLDTISRLLTVQTRHFSDWAIQRDFFIQCEKSSLQAGEETALAAYYFDFQTELDLLKQDPVPSENIAGWFLNGAGTLDAGKQYQSRYKAPAAIAAPQTVAAGLRIENMVSQQNPDRPGNQGVVLLQQEIRLLPDEYFTWEFDGGSHTGLSLDGALLGPNTIIAGTGLTGAVNISLNAVKPGNYDLGSSANPDQFSIQLYLPSTSYGIYQGEYYKCGSSTASYGTGKLTITELGNIGGHITGHFSATVYSVSGDCSIESKRVTGKFKIRRKG